MFIKLLCILQFYAACREFQILFQTILLNYYKKNFYFCWTILMSVQQFPINYTPDYPWHLIWKIIKVSLTVNPQSCSVKSNNRKKRQHQFVLNLQDTVIDENISEFHISHTVFFLYLSAYDHLVHLSPYFLNTDYTKLEALTHLKNI